MTSGGKNFNDFPENQLTIDFAFHCKHAWWNATVSPFPFVLISFGETAFPRKYWGTAFLLDYTTAGGQYTYASHVAKTKLTEN